MKYIIKDWTNKVCFGGQLFDSFEDAWGFIYETDPNPNEEDESWFDDYFVEEVKHERIKPALDEEKMYLDYFNNYLTVESFAESYGLTEEKAREILTRGRELNNDNNKGGET